MNITSIKRIYPIFEHWRILRGSINKRMSINKISKILFDYHSLYKSKGLTSDEYYDFGFDSQTEEFRRTFLGLNEQRYYLDFLNPIKYYILARNKFFTHKILEDTGIKTSALYCYYQPEGCIIDSKSIANNLRDVMRILKSRQVHECVIKTTECSHGDNVYVVKGIEYGEADCKLSLFNGSQMLLSAMLENSPLLFENVVRQTEQFSAFNPSSVNTVRFMTALYPDNKARLIAALIKIGRHGACVDNAGGGGNVGACVDMQTGKLKYAIQFDGWGKVKEITHHPDSGALIEGVRIANWDKIVEQVLNFQESFPYIKAAGWDIAITDDGPVVIEVNDFWDRTFQYFIRRGWRDEIRDCYLAWEKTSADYSIKRQPNKLTMNRLKKIAAHK